MINAIQEWFNALNSQRKAIGMPLRILAKRSSLSKATVCRILTGKKSSASIENVVAIANVLEVSISIVPRNPEKVVRLEVERRAKVVAELTQGTMALESQGLTEQEDVDTLVKKAKKVIGAKPRKRLWTA